MVRECRSGSVIDVLQLISFANDDNLVQPHRSGRELQPLSDKGESIPMDTLSRTPITHLTHDALSMLTMKTAVIPSRLKSI